MLQSEFFERTGENVTGDVYAKIENIYNNVSVDKDVFCAGWKKYKNNEFVADLMDCVLRLIKERDDLMKEKKQILAEKEDEKVRHNNELQDCAKIWDKSNKEFAKNLLLALESERMAANIYAQIEQEFGIGWIIKTKRENGIMLTESEIDYMVSKL
jgi:hypothetical protein